MEEGKHPAMKKIKLLIAIINRGKGEAVVGILRESGVTFNMIAPADCASGSDIMGVLGLSNQERDMILSVITEDKVSVVMQKLLYKLDLDKPTGIYDPDHRGQRTKSTAVHVRHFRIIRKR